MSAATLFVAAVLGAVALGIHLLDRHIREGGANRRKVQGARWASKRDLGALHVAGPQPGRLVLGRQGKRLVAGEERASVVIVGPSTVSLKTTGFAIPALLEWQGPVVATSVKSDLLLTTLKCREGLGETMIFDPTGVTGKESVQATPLSSCGTWWGAMRVAHWLASSARAGGSGGLENSDFWYAAAEKLLAPLLFAAALSGGGMAAVIAWLNSGAGSREKVTQLLQEVKNPRECEEAMSAWDANWHREERQRSSIYTTAEIVVAAFADPRVLKASEGAGYTPAKLLSGKANTLYLCAPANEQERLRTLFSAMISELVSTIYESSAKTGKPIDRRF